MTNTTNQESRLYHLTLATGHVALTSRADVADDVIALLQPIIAAGVGELPGPIPWWLIVEPAKPGWRRYHVAPNPDAPPYITGTGCWSDAATRVAWAATGTDGEIPPVPWLAVEFGPSVPLLSLTAARMLGDLERCVFWALVAAEGL